MNVGGSNIIERAFELAVSGEFATITDLKRKLKKEHFAQIDDHFDGPQLCRELIAICQSVKAVRA